MPERATYDFICIGAGIGGMTAAIVADELGLEVLVIEKTHKLGGVAAISGGQCWVPANHVAAAMGIEDSVEDALGYMLWVGGGIADERLARNYCERAREAVKFLEDHAGMRWSVVKMPDPLHGFAESVGSRAEGRLLESELYSGDALGELKATTRRNRYGEVLMAKEQYGELPGPDTLAERRDRDDRALGGSLLAPLVRNVIDRGIEVWTDTVVEELVVEGRRVTGVRVSGDSGQVIVATTRGVLLATGGYDGNLEHQRIFEVVQRSSSVALTSVTGDHLRLAGMIGAKVASPFRVRHIFLEPDVPQVRDEDGTAMRSNDIVKLGYPHMVVVDRNGSRFFDESSNSARDAAMVTIDLKRPWQFAGIPCWAIWDSQHVARYIPRTDWDVPGVVIADDLATLAKEAGLPDDALVSQVDRFNAFVDSGTDDEFGRGSRLADVMYGDHRNPGSANMGRIDQPPYYAVPMIPRAMGIGSGGLVTDEHARVIDWTESPIEGLYAAGNSVAMLELGIAYTGGNANARGMLHGFCASEHAAAGHVSTSAQGR